MLATAKRNADAETEARRAVKMVPGVPLAWATLIQFLAGTDSKAAEAAVEEAQGKLPGDESALVRVQFDEAVGRKDQAEKIYLTARGRDQGCAPPGKPRLLLRAHRLVWTGRGLSS